VTPEENKRAGSARFAQILKDKGLTPEDLVDKLADPDSQWLTKIRQWLIGRVVPTTPNIHRLAAVLDMTPKELAGEELQLSADGAAKMSEFFYMKERMALMLGELVQVKGELADVKADLEVEREKNARLTLEKLPEAERHAARLEQMKPNGLAAKERRQQLRRAILEHPDRDVIIQRLIADGTIARDKVNEMTRVELTHVATALVGLRKELDLFNVTQPSQVQ
jgi:transcriptional regulator with XRE-family HTH domain